MKRKQVGTQQVRMMPAKFIWPWKVLVFDISELDQEPEAKRSVK